VRLYNEGDIALKKGDLETAAKRWEAAYAECPSANLLYNLAQLYRKLGRNKEALALYESYLNDTANVPQTERETINARIDDLRKAIKQEEDNASKPPDGMKEPEGARAVQGEPLPQYREHDRPSWYSDTWGWVIAASGLVAVGVGGWMLVHASGLRDDADAETYSEERRASLADDADGYVLGGGIVLATGGALLVTGIIKLAAHDGEPRESRGVNVTAGIGWIGLEGRF
jgi:tetratricopeptide (TPR) repeat protein